MNHLACKIPNRLKQWKINSLYMILYDFFIAAASFFLALWLRFDCQYSSIPDDLLISYLYFIPIYSDSYAFGICRIASL